MNYRPQTYLASIPNAETTLDPYLAPESAQNDGAKLLKRGPTGHYVHILVGSSQGLRSDTSNNGYCLGP